ncbi:nickel-dependent hydrogenase large subunit, partial [Salmonella enterica subsp. enterica serovar Kentucky]|nr:nickel-dependent hydrogenase large subunit [Salmonella enterica subsp. enterica serovar Kentucky]
MTNIQSTARQQSISNEASTEVPLKEEIWNKISAFFSSEHQVDDKGQIGAYEAALMGTKLAVPDQPLEILRTLHSFDPCLACST